jgi:hypothetical protein
MHTLYERYSHFFDLVKFDPILKKFYDVVYFMSLDAEWYERVGRNIIQSYQIATVSESSANNIILYQPPGKRMKLVELIDAGIASVHGGQLPPFQRGRKILVVLVAHYFTAEWSALADRDADYITKRLTVIRKTPVTGRSPIKVNLSDHTPVDVRIFDTKLLAPASHQSLQALSTLLGDESQEKDDIPQFYKENMNIFLAEYPESFEHYALRDTEVTIKLFFLLQESLNLLAFGEVKQLFRTLATAAVQGFLVAHPWFKQYRSALRRPEFWDAYRLVERAYHGGRNESYFVGRTSDYPETRNKVWIDIDFCGCYPTAMALCPKIDVEGSK